MSKQQAEPTTEQPATTATETTTVSVAEPAQSATTNQAGFNLAAPVASQTITSEFNPNPQQPNNATPAATGDQGKQGKVMTQAEIDAIITARLDSERRKFSDYDDLKAKVKAFEDAQKTEAQKAADRLQELEAANKQLAAENQKSNVRMAIVSAASTIGLDGDAAYKLADLATLKTDEAGNVTNAADVVKAVAEKYPGLLRRGAPTVPAVNPSKTAPQTTQAGADWMQSWRTGGGAGAFWQGGGMVLPTTGE